MVICLSQASLPICGESNSSSKHLVSLLLFGRSFGVVLYELCSSRPLFPRDNADNLYTDESKDAVCDWNGIDGQQLARVFSSCPNIPSRKQEFACDLISQCLQADPLNRPQTMQEVLRHPLWGIEEYGLNLIVDDRSRMRATLGYLMALLTSHIRLFCKHIMQQFLLECSNLVASSSWQDAVESLAQRKPKWDGINSNTQRLTPLNCSVCNMRFREPPVAGEVVDIWTGGKSKAGSVWDEPVDVSKVKEATVVSEHAANQYLVSTVFGTQIKQVVKPVAQIRRRPVVGAVEELAVPNASSDPLMAKLLNWHATGALSDEELELLTCVHNMTEPGSTCIPDTSKAHYDYSLRDDWDAVKLFVPFNKPPQLQPAWQAQDASNLLNLIESIGKEDVRTLAAAARQIRNEWAHQGDMTTDVFAACANSIMSFKSAMPTLEVDGSAAMDTAWLEASALIDGCIN